MNDWEAPRVHMDPGGFLLAGGSVRARAGFPVDEGRLRYSRDVMSESSVESSLSLWERRKIEAMSRIQRVALELFDEFGYREVTVEKVANAAAVSASSIYRYFGTKEMLVLYDEADPELIDVMRNAGGGETLDWTELLAIARAVAEPVIGAVITDEVERRTRLRMQYVRTIPEVKDRYTQRTRQLEDEFRLLYAERSGRDANDLQLRMAAAITIWGCAAAVDHWAEAGFVTRLRDVYIDATKSIVAALEAILR